jgi:excisionase family DNA binding protein
MDDGKVRNSPPVRSDGDMMTVGEVAEFLNIHRITVYRMIKGGKELGQFKVGRVWRFKRRDILKFVQLGSTDNSENLLDGD